MQVELWTKRAVAGAAMMLLMGATAARADDQVKPVGQSSSDVTTELNALKARIAELEAKQNDNWLTEERASQIRGIVNDVLKDAKSRGQFADGVEAGYKDGFYIQTADKNFKLVITGFAQVRYEYAMSNATNGRQLPGTTVSNGTNSTFTSSPSDPGNASGFDIRRARIAFAGNVFTPDLTFKLEGDYYGGAVGAFTVTDAFIAYRFNDQFKTKVGSFKVPFAKAELTSDTNLTFMERPEEMAPFDPIRAIGVSLYGDVIKDKFTYEVNLNNGGANSNNLRRVDTVSISTANFDNRLGAYARLQYAGAGKVGDFTDEADLRADNREFIWMVGGAVGYESQNSNNSAFPSAQNTSNTNGASNGDGPGFTNYTLNGDLFRGTLDWSAKYQGLSLIAAGYIQQVNANPGVTLTTTGTGVGTAAPGPYGATDSSFFEWGGYGQIGYFVIPQKLEITGRAGLLLTEGYPNYGEFYSVGANYYVYGQNFKIQSDMTYTPEAAYTDSASSILQNTQDVIFRVQVQLKF